MNIVWKYREAFAFFPAAATVLTLIAIGTDGNAQDGAPPPPRPSSSPTPTFTSTATPTASSMPSAPSVTLPPSSPSSTIIIAAPTPTFTPIPTLTPMSMPSPTATPHNKAKGLKDGCLVQKKKWLLRVPCPPVHRNEEAS